MDGDAFERLLRAARSGDPDACRALWDTYAPGVVRFATARGSQEPEDLTSEVFLSLFRGLSRFRGDEGAFRGFLYTLAHRRLVDELRRRSRTIQQCTWDDCDDPRRAPSAEQGALDSLGGERARTMLDDLAPDQREVLLLRIFADLTIEQVATILGKRPGAVKALQRRGMEALRRRYAAATPAAATVEGGV